MNKSLIDFTEKLVPISDFSQGKAEKFLVMLQKTIVNILF